MSILKMINKKPRRCISSRYILYAFKYGIIPFFVVIMTINGIMLFYDSYSGKLLEIILLAVLVGSIVLAIVLFFWCKLIYMDKSGLFINSDHIPWSKIEKIFFPLISPPSVFLKYRIFGKPHYAITIFPYTQRSKLKKIIRQHLADNMNS